jgi:cytochrome c
MHRLNTLFAVFGVLAASISSSAVQAMDGATLYVERTCIACHGAQGKVPVMAEYPKIDGQDETYLLNQMKDIKSGARANAHSVAMKNVMHLISEEEMATVAKWLAGLK